jgi:voltage-gated sodium channel
MTASTEARPQNPIAAFLVREPTVLTVIVLNAVVLFLDAFPSVHARTEGALFAVDYGCMLFFVLEAVLKIRQAGFQVYWQNAWNKLDFVIVLSGLPLLVGPLVEANLSFFSIVLLGRFLRFLRVMRFIPNATEIWGGIIRALKASVGIFLVLFVLNLLLAMGANILFGEAAPEYFGNPLVSFYSLFKVFTIEGWYEIPERLAEQGALGSMLGLLRLYFVVSVLIGGILGLSLANAIFVDEMTVDNTARVEALVQDLRTELVQRNEMLYAALEEVRRQLEMLRR